MLNRSTCIKRLTRCLLQGSAQVMQVIITPGLVLLELNYPRFQFMNFYYILSNPWQLGKVIF